MTINAESDYAKKQVQWNELYYGFLNGATVNGVSSVSDEYGDIWTKITFEKDGERFEVEISADEEGNGPGFLFGLPLPSEEDNPFL